MDKFKEFVKKNNTINGTEIESLFFPQIDAHIFMSHSHKNIDEVIALAGFLNKKFGLKTFIDSCLWESAKELQKTLDSEHSWTDPVKRETYSYDQVGFSSSHAHMMLSVALSKMIDRAECVFFYNTPESIFPYKTQTNTNSPWIYSEITTTQIINKKIPSRRKAEYTRLYSDGGFINENLQLFYQLDLNHLATINAPDFNEWVTKTAIIPEDALDLLYDKIPLKKPKTFI